MTNKIVKGRVEFMEVVGEEEIFRRYLEDHPTLTVMLQELFDGVEGKPGASAFYAWLKNDEGRAERWTEVKKMKADQHADRATLTAMYATNDNVRVSKLQVDQDRWSAGHLNKDQYGTGPQVQVNNNSVNVFGDMVAEALRNLEAEIKAERGGGSNVEPEKKVERLSAGPSANLTPSDREPDADPEESA